MSKPRKGAGTLTKTNLGVEVWPASLTRFNVEDYPWGYPGGSRYMAATEEHCPSIAPTCTKSVKH